MGMLLAFVSTRMEAALLPPPKSVLSSRCATSTAEPSLTLTMLTDFRSGCGARSPSMRTMTPAGFLTSSAVERGETRVTSSGGCASEEPAAPAKVLPPPNPLPPPQPSKQLPPPPRAKGGGEAAEVPGNEGGSVSVAIVLTPRYPVPIGTAVRGPGKDLADIWLGAIGTPPGLSSRAVKTVNGRPLRPGSAVSQVLGCCSLMLTSTTRKATVAVTIGTPKRQHINVTMVESRCGSSTLNGVVACANDTEGGECTAGGSARARLRDRPANRSNR
mmetsp:Transcript_54251/g.176254  ORF Transcript_54251/g.176254 Transcript_54251/m.176254 type:complete len:273 (+) Transcript_54251:436-1254(+)